MTAPEPTTEYHIWYTAVDGVRRSVNAVDEAGVQQAIAELVADEARRQLLATSVGLSVEPHEHEWEIWKVNTTSEPVDVPAVPAPE